MGELEEIYKYGTLVIWPEDNIREIVNNLRKKYDPESQKICEAHITLTQPFEVEPNEQIWNKINNYIKKFNGFEITVGPVEQFGSSQVIKLNIQPKEKILELRNGLHRLGYFNTKLPYTEGFIPHMTISEGGIKEDKKIKNIITQLNEKMKAMKFKFGEITYIRPDKNFYFKVKKIIKLGK